MRSSKHTRTLTLSALFCALVFVMTWVYVPTPSVGNVNLGDAALLLSAWTLGGPWAALSAALGATLADLSSGFALYAPATFLIKTGMVFAALGIRKLLSRLPRSASAFLSALAAELVMVMGYFLYEFLVLGMLLRLDGYTVAALVNIPFNCVQGAVAIAIAIAVKIPASKLLASLGRKP